MDYAYWEELNETIQAEPLDPDGLSPEVRGMLAAIGIEKGKKFAPDERMKKILTEAANVGAITARALAARPQENASTYPASASDEPIWRRWTSVDGITC